MTKSLTYVEIDLPYCSLAYGTAPCAAVAVGDFIPTFSAVFNNSNQNFTALDASLTPDPSGSLLVPNGGLYPRLYTPGVAIAGATNNIVRIDVTRESEGAAWSGTVLYVNEVHGVAGAYRKQIPNSFPVGQRTVLDFDMSVLDAGGNDWITHTIAQIRFDLDAGGATSGSFRIHGVYVGRYATTSDATGSDKCFNTLKTCQDTAHFTNSPVTLRYAVPCDYLPRDIEAVPSITGVDFSPGTVSLGKNLGERASVTVSFKDHPWSDTGIGGDKYLSSRGYDPYKRGTYWGKFRARHPFVRGRPLRLIRGFEGQPLASMETRHYVIDSFDGPRVDGTFALVAKDVLKLASGERAKAPRMSKGRLVSGITSGSTSFTLTPSGIGDLEYPASGFLNLAGKEVVAFMRSGDAVTLTGRGQFNTTAVAHSAGARAQLCLYYNGADPADIISDQLTNYAGVSSAFIPLATWKANTAASLGTVYTALIAEPTGVEDLVSEIIEQANLVVGWDDVSQTIQLDVLRNILTTAAKFSSSNISPGSLKTKEQPDARVSQVQIYFGMRNPLEPLDSADNYQCTEIVAALESESNYGSAVIKTIYSRWIPFAGRSVATRLGSILVARFQDPPRRFNFNVFREGVGVTPTLMGGYRLEYFGAQDATGASAEVPIQTTRLKPGAASFDIEAEEILFTGIDPADNTNRLLVVDTNQFDQNVRALHDTIYPAPTAADVAAGVNLTVMLVAGAVVGSHTPTTAGRALNFGTAADWPAGFPIKFVCAGTLQGCGGLGGNGAVGPSPNIIAATPGQQGGTALYTRVPISIELRATGRIQGGGGGGGGGALSGVRITQMNGEQAGGGGGGGGAGVDWGSPGQGGRWGGANGSWGSTVAGGPGGPAGWIRANNIDYWGGNGGGGGGPGQPGAPGGHANPIGGETGPAPGGPAGCAIDGISYCTFTVNAGIRAGQEIN